MVAFPDQFVAMAIGGNGTGDLDPDANVRRAQCHPHRSHFMAWTVSGPNQQLSTFNPEAPGPEDSVWNLLWNSQPDVGGQMVFGCSNDSTYRMNGGVPGDPATILHNAINAGSSYGMEYLELISDRCRALPA